MDELQSGPIVGKEREKQNSCLDLDKDFHQLLGQTEQAYLSDYCETYNYSETDIAAVRSEIARYSVEDPQATIRQALRENEILVFGEIHRDHPNVLREIGAHVMSDLKRSGATHLAIELDQKYQPAIDEFVATGEFPNELKKKFNDSYKHLLESARENNLAIKAIDDHDVDYAQGKTRDVLMARNVEHILQQKGTTRWCYG